MSDIKTACEQLTIIQVANALGIDGLKVGMNKSPFRKVKSGTPFSIFANGHAFRDHGNEEHKGGPWQFVTLAKPSWDKKETVVFLLKLAGFDTDEAWSKNQYKKLKIENRKLKYKARQAALNYVEQFATPTEWSNDVKQRFVEAVKLTPAKRITERRGWNVEWADRLVCDGLISAPFLPWGDKEKFKKSRRGVAFLVQAPIKSKTKELDFISIGYHQIYRVNGSKQFVFVPYVPAKDKCSTKFQEILRTQNNKILPLPFVLGDFTDTKSVIIAEGQWDAITVFGAAGGFDNEMSNTSVLGLRGAQSIEPFFTFYSSWLRKTKPNILLLIDNDSAGKKWVEREKLENKIIEKPTLLERLSHIVGANKVKWAMSPVDGEDFGDLYKRTSPSKTDVRQFLNEQGLIEL